jgi:WhiB family redox-sensing transcriptional regulator
MGKGRPSELPPNAEVAEMLRDGADITELAARLGASPSTIGSRLNAAGWGTDGHPTHKRRRPRSLPVVNRSWTEQALCMQFDPEIFFPEKGASTREAKQVCGDCEVRIQCLESALANDYAFGVFGGLSSHERRQLKKGRPAKSPTDMGLVREWARNQGIEVRDLGRLSPDVVAAYRAAHQEAAS